MRRWSGFAAFSLLLIVGLFTLACGSSRTLKSVTVSPATATAQNGQAQFSATGVFSGSSTPRPLTSRDITWCVGTSAGVCNGNINAGGTISQDGLAQCTAGFSGNATVLAGKLASKIVNPDGGQPMSVFSSAQLTCP